MELRRITVGFIKPFATNKSERTFLVDEVFTPKGNLKKSFVSLITTQLHKGVNLSLTPVVHYGEEYLREWGEMGPEARLDIHTELNRGHKVAAVKAYRDHTTKGLKEGLSFINWLMSRNAQEDLWDKIDLAAGIKILKNLHEGFKIAAIRVVRAQTGADLRTAKAFIDSEWVWQMVNDMYDIRKEVA